MARKKKTEVVSTLWERAKWKGFVNVKLQQQEKEEISKNVLGTEGAFQFLEDVATDGYKVSLSYSIPEDVHTVSITGIYLAKPNAGITMSMRHRDLAKAITALAWCHEQAGKAGEWEDRYTLSGDDDW